MDSKVRRASFLDLAGGLAAVELGVGCVPLGHRVGHLIG